MIKFFRQSYAIQYVVIALLAIALWIPAFISGRVALGFESPITPLFNLIDRLLGFSPLAQHLFAFVLIMVEALFFNLILVDNQIVGKVGTMGAFVFVLLMSLTCTQTNFYPFILSLFFILLIIKLVFEVNTSQTVELDLLKAGGYIALASMCYFPAILLLVWVMISLSIAKKGSLRLDLIPLTGFFFVYFLYFTCIYLFGDFLSLIREYRGYFLNLTFSVTGFNLKNTILLILLVAMSIFLMFSSVNLEKAIAVRTKVAMSIVLLVFSVFILFLGGNVLYNGLIFFALSIVFSYEFSSMGNTGWADLFLTVFLLLVMANHYYFKLL